jgi:uncharacterized membrane protein YfcA
LRRAPPGVPPQMPDAKTTLFVLLAVVGVLFLAVWIPDLVRASRAGAERVRPNAWELVVGYFTDFLDTLGIGSFATTTTLYRMRRTIDDRLLPGTLNVGHTLPTILQAYIYIDNVGVEMTTLVSMIVAAVAGSLLGAPIVARWERRRVQLGLGAALLVLVGVLVYRQLWTEPKAGTLGLSGALFGLGVAANFVLGALMTIGVGLYAPCLVLVSMLGMNPTSGFPIMMGSCAFLMPLASVPFIRQRAYSPRATLGLTLAGLPAVWIAAKYVTSLDLYWVKWLVAAVVIYTAITLLVAASREMRMSPNEGASR